MRRVLGLLALAAAGCTPDLAARSELGGLRVLALLADPLELGVADEVHLEPVVYSETSSVVQHDWRFCPINTGSRGGYACVNPACNFTLEPDARGRTRARPATLALQCVEALAATNQAPTDAMNALPEIVEVVFRYTASVPGAKRVAIARLPLHTRSPPTDRNRAPVITSVRVGGVATSTGAPTVLPPVVDQSAEIAVIVEVDPASLDEGETALVSFYATDGELNDDRVEGTTAQTTLTAVTEDSLIVYAVARDGRGGQVVAGPFQILFR